MEDKKNNLLITLINLSIANGHSVGVRPPSDKFSYPQDRLSISFNVERLTDEDKLNLLLFVTKHNVGGANGTPSIEKGYTDIEFVDFYEIDDMSLETLTDLISVKEKINKDIFFYEYQGE